MFSSDKNIDIIGKLIEIARHYLKLQGEYIKLGAIDKTVRLVTALIIVAVLSLIIILMSLAVTVALAHLVGYGWAFCIVGIFYFLAFIIFMLFKKQLIERPLVKFLTTLLMEN